jgi:hypothetical protein
LASTLELIFTSPILKVQESYFCSYDLFSKNETGLVTLAFPGSSVRNRTDKWGWLEMHPGVFSIVLGVPRILAHASIFPNVRHFLLCDFWNVSHPLGEQVSALLSQGNNLAEPWMNSLCFSFPQHKGKKWIGANMLHSQYGQR